MAERHPELDGVRGIALVTVLVAHLDLPHLRGGFLGVDLFFTLSGFLLTDLLWRSLELRHPRALRDYLSARA